MHEMSIASALLELVRQHAPPGSVVRRVHIEAGPLQGLDPEAMQWAWQSTVAEGPHAAATLDIDFLPWRMHCPACGKEWSSPQLAQRCECGAKDVYPIEGRELRLMSLTVDDAVSEESPHAGSGDRERSEAQR